MTGQNWPNGQIGSTTAASLQQMRLAALEVVRQVASRSERLELLDMLGILTPLQEAQR